MVDEDHLVLTQQIGSFPRVVRQCWQAGITRPPFPRDLQDRRLSDFQAGIDAVPLFIVRRVRHAGPVVHHLDVGQSDHRDLGLQPLLDLDVGLVDEALTAEVLER